MGSWNSGILDNDDAMDWVCSINEDNVMDKLSEILSYDNNHAPRYDSYTFDKFLAICEAITILFKYPNHIISRPLYDVLKNEDIAKYSHLREPLISKSLEIVEYVLQNVNDLGYNKLTLIKSH